MTLVLTAANNEFGTSTGSNVDATAMSSLFDYPPDSSTDLMITAQSGDLTPREFEVGDTYDVSWQTPGGPESISNAVVVRSDAAPGGGGIIVFEGTDQDGDPAQVIWTPDMNLNGWYDANYSPLNPPHFYTQDMNSAYNHTYNCFAAGTMIDTPDGPAAVEHLRPGDVVTTLDAGHQTILWAGQRSTLGFGRNSPVRFAPGALGNNAPLSLSQNHRVLIRHPWAQLAFGANEVLVPAKALVGYVGTLDPQPTVTYVHFLLEEHHLIRANGALCETLLALRHLPQEHAGDLALATALHAHNLSDRDQTPARPILRRREASVLAMALAGQQRHSYEPPKDTPAQSVCAAMC